MTKDPRTLDALTREIIAVTEEAQAYLARSGPALALLASKLRQEESPAVLEDVAQLAEGLGWLVDIANDLGQAPSLDDPHRQNLVAFPRSIEGFLHEFNAAMETGDKAMRADLLEFELSPLLNQLGETLAKVREASVREHGGEVH